MIKLIILAAVILVVQSKTPIPSSKLFKYLMPQPPPVPIVDKTQSRSVVENFVEGQRINHFGSLHPLNFSFRQRYFMNGEFFQPGGPIFIFVGGEWRAGPEMLTPGVSLLMQMVEELRGYAFYLEHRFFGESIPPQMEELSAINMQFLNINQALNDIAYFIHYVKQSHITPGAETSGVILVGAHYSGSLVSWFRQKYPHLVVGAWAAGAPLLSVNDHFQFKELAGAVYRNVGGDACYNRLSDGFQQLERYVETGTPELINELFDLCEPIDISDPKEIWAFFSVVSEVFGFMVQTSEEDEIRRICNIILDPAVETPAHGLANFILPLLFDDPDSCFPFNYHWFIEVDSDPSLNGTAVQTGLRQWSFLICSGLGWYHSSASNFQPFGSSFPVDLLFIACEDLYGPEFNRGYLEFNSRATNIHQGGQYNRITNVVYSYGFNDPWRTIGMQVQHNDHAPVINIRGQPSYREMYATSDDDSLELTRAKQSIKGYLRRWLAEADNITVVPVDEFIFD